MAALIPPNGKITVIMPHKHGPVTAVFDTNGELWGIRVEDEDGDNWGDAEWKRARPRLVKKARTLCGKVASWKRGQTNG